MAKFAIGDRVEVVDAGTNAGSYYPTGATGTVERIDNDGDCWIDFDPRSGVLELGGSRNWCAMPERLRLLNAAPSPTLRARLRALLRNASAAGLSTTKWRSNRVERALDALLEVNPILWGFLFAALLWLGVS